MQTKGTKESVENWDEVAGGLRAAPHSLCSPFWPGGLPLLPGVSLSQLIPADPRFCMNPLQFSTDPVLIPGTKGADSFPGQKVLIPTELPHPQARGARSSWELLLVPGQRSCTVPIHPPVFMENHQRGARSVLSGVHFPVA